MTDTSPQKKFTALNNFLLLVIAGLALFLFKIAVIDPNAVVEKEYALKNEARLRLKYLRELEMMHYRVNGSYSDNFDSLRWLIMMAAVNDSVRTRMIDTTSNTYSLSQTLFSGTVLLDSLFYTPKSGKPFIIEVDTFYTVDTTGTGTYIEPIRIDTVKHTGRRYVISDPDGYGTVGSLQNDALRHQLSWE